MSEILEYLLFRSAAERSPKLHLERHQQSIVTIRELPREPIIRFSPGKAAREWQRAVAQSVQWQRIGLDGSRFGEISCRFWTSSLNTMEPDLSLASNEAAMFWRLSANFPFRTHEGRIRHLMARFPEFFPWLHYEVVARYDELGLRVAVFNLIKRPAIFFREAF